MSRRAYPAYKPSGVEWLGEIPAGWITVSVKRKYAIQLGKMLQNNPESDADVSVSYVKALHVNWGNVNTSDLPEMWANPAEIGQFGIKSGDLLVCEGGEAGRAGIVSTLPTPCIIQNALHRVRGKYADVRFLQYVLHAVGSGGWFEVLCNKATIAHFTREKLAELRMPLPLNIDEQRAVVAFLDRETARIDALTAKKGQQIELLQEKRAALISRAVTKGLNPNARMKDSGIEWLGEIPEHWNTCKLKYFCHRITKGTTPTTLGKEFIDDGIRFVRIENISDNMTLGLDNCKYIDQETHQILQRSQLQIDDVVVAIAGAIGRLAIVTKEDLPANCNQAVGIISLDKSKIMPEWVAYALSSDFVRNMYDQIQVQSAQANLSLEDVGLATIPSPAIYEQRAITAFLDRETARIDALIEKINNSIDLLREYRTALISAAVTGNIDVREEVS